MRMQSMVYIQKHVTSEMNTGSLLFPISVSHLLLLCQMSCHLVSFLRPQDSRPILCLSIRDRHIHSLKFAIRLQFGFQSYCRMPPASTNSMLGNKTASSNFFFLPWRKSLFQGTLQYKTLVLE